MFRLSRRAVAGWAIVATLVLPFGIAQAKTIHPNVIGSHHFAVGTSSPAIEFGGSPVIPMHYKVTIHEDGHVSGAVPAGPTKGDLQIDVRALLKLAEAEGFFSLPSKISGHLRNVDNGPRYITIYTASRPHTVTLEPTAFNSGFLQLYGVLNELVSRGSSS